MTKEIRDDGHVVRHCKRNHIDTDGTPLPAAFELRVNEEYLSVNWLEYFGTSSIEENLVCVCKEILKHRSTTKRERFVVLNVKDVKSTIKKEFDITLSIKDLQEEDYPSHAGIWWYTNDDDVLHELAEIVEKDDVYPAQI